MYGKEKKYHGKILFLARISFKSKVKCRHFSDIIKAEIITGRLVLQKMLNKMIYAEVNNTKWKYASTERKEEGQK